MSVLALGLSYRTAPVAVLERAALTGDARAKLLHDLAQAPSLSEAVVVSTCNRVEIYADVAKFHGGLADVAELLARHAGLALEEMTPHLYVHYEERAVAHLFAVASGLDSMVIGEAQILGQVREALRLAQAGAAVGRVLNELFQQALRVGKRAHAETGIDRAGRSVVDAALAHAETLVGDLEGRPALVIGAGAMSALAAHGLRRREVSDLVVANRTFARGQRLAAAVNGRAIALDELAEALGAADLVVSCTGSTGLVLGAAEIAAAQATRAGRPQVLLDLAVPRDVDPDAAGLAGVQVVNLDGLAATLADLPHVVDVDAVRAIVGEEVAAYALAERASQVAPTVVALRSLAAAVVQAELDRLGGRLPALDERSRLEVAQTVRRVVEKLLHGPVVRMKELATEPGGQAYAEALRELFDLDPRVVDAVSRPGEEP